MAGLLRECSWYMSSPELAAETIVDTSVVAEQAFRAALRGLSRDAGYLWASSLDALAVVDDERRYLRVNERTVRLLEAPLATILGARLDDFTPQEHWPRMVRNWQELQRRGRLYGDYEVLKSDGSRIVIEFCALRGFHAGEHLIVARETPQLALAKVQRHPGRTATHAPRLTKRETEVIALVAEGNSANAIGAELHLSPATIKTHLASVYHKLGVRDRAAAVATALRRGIIS
jgi:DNA-binding CsgD family transcriptional regulator